MPLQSDSFPFAIERGLVNAEDLRRFEQAAGPLQDFPQVHLFEFLERNQRANFRLHGRALDIFAQPLINALL